MNLVGIWRWLGRQRVYEDGAKRAAQTSRRASGPTLFPATALAGMTVCDIRGETLGKAVEAMVECASGEISYVVIASGGTGGIDETLRSVPSAQIDFHGSGLILFMTRAEYERREPIEAGNWPGQAPVMGTPNAVGHRRCKPPSQGSQPMRFLKDNSLTIVLLLLLAGSILGQWLTGWHVALEDSARHQQPGMGLAAYTSSPEFLSSVFENWQSEFPAMSAYVVLTAILVQRGSSESKDPDSPPRDADLADQARKPGARAILRQGRFARAVYSRSLGLALFLLFLLSFVMHWTQSAKAAAEAAREHGEAALTPLGYLGDPQLWFESFQNWQSEFLSTAVLVLLSIALRQRESPETTPVAAPHSHTGE